MTYPLTGPSAGAQPTPDHSLAKTAREECERLALAIEAGEFGIWTYYPSDDCLILSGQAARLMACGSEPMRTDLEGFLGCFHEADRDSVRDSFTRARRDEPYLAEHRVVWPDKSVHWVSLRGRCSGRDDGRAAEFNGVCEDVTLRKHAEAEIERHREELARSNADLQQFAYVTSHDLQAPLRTITSYAQLLTRRHQEKLSGEAEEFLGYMVEAAKQMDTLIRDLLAYSRVITPDDKPFAPVQMDGTLQWALMNLHKAIREAGATITFDELPTVLGDQVQLVQVFQHLLANSIKYHSERPPNAHVSVEQRGDMYVFSVRDNGIGIDPEYHQRIFGVLKRLHGKEVPGTGIGLAICKRIVERHGGRLWVESAPGEGATFFFSLPNPALNGAEP